MLLTSTASDGINFCDDVPEDLPTEDCPNTIFVTTVACTSNADEVSIRLETLH